MTANQLVVRTTVISCFLFIGGCGQQLPTCDSNDTIEIITDLISEDVASGRAGVGPTDVNVRIDDIELIDDGETRRRCEVTYLASNIPIEEVDESHSRIMTYDIYQEGDDNIWEVVDISYERFK
ncbi:hypothetical protein HH1059_13880 [Halorhodospira halochloris]|uniref:Uncharacterized protein n=1 Tax=Halorhodospira halochloris TaxID=1052 RepID=A0A0X8X9P6_HALHR|nr:hypothetical protein [Halorhodospira halochloris]MBK1653004.1 hypothetical protein [Halorhodospira halochloris]BAU58095.2 hypothetical protein HH1059_13880 [Halorhodospira halochloris]